MANSNDEPAVPSELANEHGQIWDGGRRDLESTLADWYGVDTLWLMGDWYHEGRGEMLYEVLVVHDGEDEHLVAEDVPVFGHFESGAAGVDVDDLPGKQAVQESAGVEGDDGE